MAWLDDLAKLLRLDSGEQAYTGYPQMQVGLTKPRQAGYATGFLEGATGADSMQPKNPITDPNYFAYEQGKNTGEAVGIGAMAVPGYVAALKAGAPKAYNALENYMVKNGGMINMIEDGSGKPLTLYHGTKSDIEEFIPSKGGEYGGGIYFGETPSQASFFAKNAKGIEGENIIPVNLDIKNPLNVTAYERDKVRSKSIKQLEKKGYDGIVATGLTGEKQYIAFRPEQVISTITKQPMTRKEMLEKQINEFSNDIYSGLQETNKSTFPKIPVENVFKNPQGKLPEGKIKSFDDVMEMEASLPTKEIDISAIVPTQRNINFDNLKKVKDVKDAKDAILAVENDGKYYLIDGHHRVANEILKNKNKINVKVYKE